MIHKLTDRVWFGNWEAPFECIGQVGSIINVAHVFSRRRGTHVYWERLEQLPYTTLYFRLAKRDREDVDDGYLSAMESVVSIIEDLNAFPVLTHCQLGGHRGPTSAIMVAWLLANRNEEYLHSLHLGALECVPGLARGRNYYKSAMELMRRNSVR